jgi:hypothetical protein
VVVRFGDHFRGRTRALIRNPRERQIEKRSSRVAHFSDVVLGQD